MPPIIVFADRKDAGRALVPALRKCALNDPVILALPRGGVPVAAEIAREMDAVLDVLVVRKLGAPMQPELAIGAIASGGVRVLNEDLIALWPDLDDQRISEIIARETEELSRREQVYRGDRPFPDLRGRDVVLVDDGLATGATMRAATEVVNSLLPSKLVVAAPVGAADAVKSVAELVDDVVCLDTPSPFVAIGNWYDDFGQTSDAEVRELLAAAEIESAAP